MTLEFGECLAPFEVFQPFFATSEMLVLVAAPPKKKAPNAEILHIGCVLGWGLHPAPTWMCENDSVPSRCYVSPCYGHPLCLASRRWIRHDSAIQSESQVYHPGTHGCHTRCTHENMETCKIEHFIFETNNKSKKCHPAPQQLAKQCVLKKIKPQNQCWNIIEQFAVQHPQFSKSDSECSSRL